MFSFASSLVVLVEAERVLAVAVVLVEAVPACDIV